MQHKYGNNNLLQILIVNNWYINSRHIESEISEVQFSLVYDINDIFKVLFRLCIINIFWCNLKAAPLSIIIPV